MERVPVIVQFYPGFDSYMNMEYIAVLNGFASNI